MQLSSGKGPSSLGRQPEVFWPQHQVSAFTSSHIVTASKALVTTSDALVNSSFLLLLVRHLLLLAMHVFLVETKHKTKRGWAKEAFAEVLAHCERSLRSAPLVRASD